MAASSEASTNAEVFRRHALALGFARVGFAPVEPPARFSVYRAWLDAERHGEMSYLARDTNGRENPRALLGEATTLVAVAMSYRHVDPVDVPADRLAGGPRAVIARYARGEDYHMVLRHRLRKLADAVAAELKRPVAARICVDTAPLLEREAALAAGLGFVAKNTMLIAPGLGSYVLLGELLTDVPCAPDEPMAPRCGQCRACLDACPTGAFVDAWTLDARRCISYLTIELVGAIPRKLRPLIGDRIFGCDVCQEVCPFNHGEAAGGEPQLEPRPGSARPALRRMLGLGAAQFRKWQRRSATRRIHRVQLLRNVAVALGNVGSPDDIPLLAAALAKEPPLVRAHVVWALGAIAARHPDARPTVDALLTTHNDDDPAVREEIAHLTPT
jgi:epoxyqueuosine reductase